MRNILSERRDHEEESDKLERRYEEEALFKEKNKEEFRVLEEVFDRLTLQAMLKLYNRGTIDELYGAIKAGKEARVYWATQQDGTELAIKIYYTHTADFRKGMMKYIEGDPRFKRIRRNPRSIVYTWTQKEFNNLKLASEAEVNSPRPVDFYRNILVMTFIGEDGVPAPLLREIDPEEPQDFYYKTVEEMKLLYQHAGLAHGDLSEYNIMVWEEKPVIFDLSQAMLTIHPMAEMLVKRDIQNINNYFGRLGVETRDHEELEEWITGGTQDIYEDT
jgi:RIO kinase 1